MKDRSFGGEWAGYDQKLPETYWKLENTSKERSPEVLTVFLHTFTDYLLVTMLETGCATLLCETPVVLFCSPFLLGRSHTFFAARLLQSHCFLPSQQRIDTPLVGRSIPYEAKWVKSLSPPDPQRTRAVSHWLGGLLTESADKIKGVISVKKKNSRGLRMILSISEAVQPNSPLKKTQLLLRWN